MKDYAYLFGQVLGTHSFYLKDEFLKPDEYSELQSNYFLPGGETGTAATVLAAYGQDCMLDGTHIGTEVGPMLRDFYKDKCVDLSSLYFDPEYKGLMDYVVVAGMVRSPMGYFQELYQKGIKRWNAPNEEGIRGCKVAAIDPFFMEETRKTAELCVKYEKSYVTIDCPHTEYLHQHAAVNIVSKECLEQHYKGMAKEEVFKLLQQNTDGLVIITMGQEDMLYGRKNQEMKRMKPFDVEVKSTLGAGDTFKAGCVYGLMHDFEDDRLVKFASAGSAVAISRAPLPLNPPTLDEVFAML